MVIGEIFKRKAIRWLQTRGIIVRRVTYRTEVPQEPLSAQPLLMGRMGIERPIIFDVGANRGMVTARYRKMFPKAEIYCFEPLPELYEGLVERFAEDGDIHIYPLAITDKAGMGDFHLTGFHTTNSLQPREAQGRRYYPKFTASTGESIKVKTITLDAFCAEQSIERVDILKFDIQGGERKALMGAANLLGNNLVKLVFTESALIQHYQDEALLHEITSLLVGHGLSLYDLYNLYRGRNGQLRYCEAIFINSEMRAKAVDTFSAEP